MRPPFGSIFNHNIPFFQPKVRHRTVHPVRQSILEILKRDGYATVAELAEKLEMAPVSVRHHIDLLIGDNLVCTPRVRRGAGAGRPKRVYTLTPEADAYFPKNYRQLADDSLRALKRALSTEQLLAVMSELASRTAAQAPAELRSLPPDQRVEAMTRFLSDQGYMAECEIDGDTALLHTCNCPYVELATPHRELCHMDLCLMNELSGLELQRIAHIIDGDARCSYRLQLADRASDEKLALVLDVPSGRAVNAS